MILVLRKIEDKGSGQYDAFWRMMKWFTPLFLVIFLVLCGLLFTQESPRIAVNQREAFWQVMKCFTPIFLSVLLALFGTWLTLKAIKEAVNGTEIKNLKEQVQEMKLEIEGLKQKSHSYPLSP